LVPVTLNHSLIIKKSTKRSFFIAKSGHLITLKKKYFFTFGTFRNISEHQHQVYSSSYNRKYQKRLIDESNFFSNFKKQFL